jgi:hypothetical protein
MIPAMQPLQQRRSGKAAQLGRLILSDALLLITLQYINADLSCSVSLGYPSAKACRFWRKSFQKLTAKLCAEIHFQAMLFG